MKALLLAITLLLLAAAIPTASAEPLPEPQPICSEILQACVHPEGAVIDEERIRDLIGPCTCPPIE